MDPATEQYIMLILADGNLPTGSFVASSGLESYAKHGFLSDSSTSKGLPEETLEFIRNSLENYSHSALPFATDSHLLVSHLAARKHAAPDVKSYLKKMIELDAFYESMTLNHVTRRASKAQGVALLTLFSKGFSRPPFMFSDSQTTSGSGPVEEFVDSLKLEIRRGNTHGHLPVCWGALTAALGLTLERSQYLHLFLQARGLLSAAIRMNVLGPYASQQLLLHAVRPVIESQINRCKNIHTGICPYVDTADESTAQSTDVPANTWPLGEILAARHDLQHSRIFNS